MILSSETKSEIQWWIANVCQWNGSPVQLPSPSLIITTDAAKVYQMTNAHVEFKIDITHDQAYTNHQGGAKSVRLCNQAQKLWKWCLLHQTIVAAEYLQGIHNRDADQASRIFNNRRELMI